MRQDSCQLDCQRQHPRTAQKTGHKTGVLKDREPQRKRDFPSSKTNHIFEFVKDTAKKTARTFCDSFSQHLRDHDISLRIVGTQFCTNICHIRQLPSTPHRCFLQYQIRCVSGLFFVLGGAEFKMFGYAALSSTSSLDPPLEFAEVVSFSLHRP